MRFNRWLVDQLSRPSSIFTGWLLAAIWNRRNRALNDFALAALDLSAGERVLEVGFGGGYLLEKMSAILSEGLAAGIDASPALVGLARRRFGGQIRTGRMDIQTGLAEAIPHPAERFDKAVSVNSIFFWKDLPAGLAELNRVLREDGRLVLVFTDQRSLQERGIASCIEWQVHYQLQRAGFHVTGMTRMKDTHRQFVSLLAFKHRPGKSH